MSTLEVICGRCDKRFRVRAEFAGKSTRCPGCSAPITIGAATRPIATRDERADRPRPKPRKRDDDDEMYRPAANWKPVGTAFAREQTAVLSVLATFVTGILIVLFRIEMNVNGPPDEVLIGLLFLFLFSPLITAGAFAIAARVAALKAPPEAIAKGVAVSSLLCSIAAVGSLLVFMLTIMSSIGSHRPEPLESLIAAASAIVCGLAAWSTFGMFVAQVGIAQKSNDLSKAFGRTGIAIAICILSLVAIAMLITLVSAIIAPSNSYRGGYHEPEEEMFLQAFVVVLPLLLAVMLIVYHRLLAAGRRAVRGAAEGRYEG